VALHPGLGLRFDERLREFDFGAWEGLTWPEIVERFPDLAERTPTQARLYAPDGGEHFDDVVARVRAFLDDLHALGPQARVLAVAHAGVLHAAVAALRPEGVDPAGIVFSTASYTRFAMDERGARIITLNDVRHLDSPA
jgi:broad specificity phosphatase PhoE